MATKSNKRFKKLLVIAGIIITAEVIWLLSVLMRGRTIAIMQPAGTIGEQQRDLILLASGLGLLVILPVFALLFFILWRYRDGNVKAKYTPDWDSSRTLETIWWGIPIAIIFVLAVVTYKTSHSLDPYRPLESSTKPLTIQVVALQWKWLFIYPEQNIATVNYLQIPEDTPINFQITSDAPMNSFWVPQLGGQVYAMSGMQTKLHLEADEPGLYQGSSANISGEGFAGMRFTVEAVTNQNFNSWIQEVWKSPDTLTMEEYHRLATPSKDHPITLYSSRDQGLYNSIMDSYMSGHSSDNSADGHNAHRYMEDM